MICYKERLGGAGWGGAGWGSRQSGSGVVTSVWSRPFEGKDEPVTTARDRSSAEKFRVPSRPVDEDYMLS